MTLHLLGIVVTIAFILLCTLLPFLPGSYDNLAVALSEMAHSFGIRFLTQPDNQAAKDIAQKGNQITTNQDERGQANNGAFYDVQVRVTGPKTLDSATKRDV